MSRRQPVPLPPRIAALPDATAWPETALLTLPEAAALLWPTGLLTTKSLRNAQKAGKLATVTIAGKVFTNRRALEDMSQCVLTLGEDSPQVKIAELSFAELVKAKTARGK